MANSMANCLKVRSNEKRCVTFQRAHNNMFTHAARARCPDACPPVATLVSLTALLTNLQLARPNPPPTFPTHVDWCMYASMSGSPVPTHTNDAPRHPTARMKHQPSPPALLDGTGLLQMPLQRAQSPETMQDNRSNWDHMRHTRSHKRQHEPNETPRHSATHTHLRGSSNAPLTALDPPISLPQASAAIGVHFRPKPEAEGLAEGSSFLAKGSSFCSSFANRIYKTACALETLHTKSRTSLKKPPHAGSALHAGTLIPIILRPKAWPKAQVSRTGYTKPHVLSKHFIQNLVQVCKNHHMPAVRCTPASLFLFMYSPEIPKSRSRAFGQAFGQAQGKGKIPQQQKEVRSLPARAQQHARPRSTRLVLRRLPPCGHPCLPHRPPHEPATRTSQPSLHLSHPCCLVHVRQHEWFTGSHPPRGVVRPGGTTPRSKQPDP